MSFVASGEMDARSGWHLWLARHPGPDDGVYPAEAEDAFRAGYELARSQSTQGGGFWDPETGQGS